MQQDRSRSRSSSGSRRRSSKGRRWRSTSSRSRSRSKSSRFFVTRKRSSGSSSRSSGSKKQQQEEEAKHPQPQEEQEYQSTSKKAAHQPPAAELVDSTPKTQLEDTLGITKGIAILQVQGVHQSTRTNRTLPRPPRLPGVQTRRHSSQAALPLRADRSSTTVDNGCPEGISSLVR